MYAILEIKGSGCQLDGTYNAMVTMGRRNCIYDNKPGGSYRDGRFHTTNIGRIYSILCMSRNYEKRLPSLITPLLNSPDF